MGIPILITGAGGFVGPHLTELLAAHGHTPICQVQDEPGFRQLYASQTGGPLPESTPVVTADLRDPASLGNLFASFRFEAVVHLAGLSFVPDCWKNPELALEVNALGTVRLLQKARENDWAGKFLLISTGQVYGSPASATDQLPLTETSPLRPDNPYSSSKLAAENFSHYYADDSLQIIIARPFNHIGPGQAPSFVVPAFLSRIDEAMREGRDYMTVGDLESARDFTDVRDVVESYRVLLEQARPGVYNVCSGRPTTIREVLETAQAAAGASLDFRVNQELLRPEGPSIHYGAAAPLNALGWRPRLTLRQSIEDAWEKFQRAGGSVTA